MNIFGLYIELWIVITLISVIGVILLALLGLIIFGLLSYKKYPKATEHKKYAFVLCARNEEKVIANCIASIRAMDYPQDKITIFVVANNCSENDKTAEIARKLGEEVFEFRDKQVTNIAQAMGRFFNYIKARYGNYSEFDGYIRMDADNLFHKDYISKLNDAFCVNPTVIVSYRANQNFNDGIRASLTCSMVTTVMMAMRMFSGWGVNPIITGPGALIGSNVLEKMGGWHCKAIADDTNLSVELIKHKIKTHFCYDAIFYDEQVTKYKLIFSQRIRWTKGTNQVFHRYWFTMIARVFSRMWKSAIFLVIGLFPAGLCSILATVGFGVFAVVSSVMTGSFDPVMWYLIITAILNTVPFWITTTLTYVVERKRIKVSFWKKLLYIFVSPLGYIIHNLCDVIRYFRGSKHKPIPHGETKKPMTLLG